MNSHVKRHRLKESELGLNPPIHQTLKSIPSHHKVHWDQMSICNIRQVSQYTGRIVAWKMLWALGLAQCLGRRKFPLELPGFCRKNKNWMQKHVFRTVIGVICTKSHMGPWVLSFKLEKWPQWPHGKGLVTHLWCYLEEVGALRVGSRKKLSLWRSIFIRDTGLWLPPVSLFPGECEKDRLPPITSFPPWSTVLLQVQNDDQASRKPVDPTRSQNLAYL